MSQKIGIMLLVALCSCSTNGPDVTLPEDPPSGSAGTAPAPDSDALPSTARLVPEPVDSVEDVPGSYVQPFALPGQVSLITIETPSYGMGSYELYRSCGLPTCVPESGTYDIVATNPAIGFAALSLVDQSGTVRVTYVLDYLWRDSEGTLVAIQLRALLGNGAGPTQVWWRMPAGTGTPASPAQRKVGTEPGGEPTPATVAAIVSPSLAGVFVRALPVYGDLDALTIATPTWSESTATGSYHAAYPYCLPWCLGEDGDYELDFASTATGTGRLSLVPTSNPAAAHDYAVYAIWRTPDGTPAAIQLQRVDGVVPSGPVFNLYRPWWGGPTAAAQVPADACGIEISLATYYRAQALECGMSACWAMAPWYSAWAQYYDGLASAQSCYAAVP